MDRGAAQYMMLTRSFAFWRQGSALLRSRLLSSRHEETDGCCMLIAGFCAVLLAVVCAGRRPKAPPRLSKARRRPAESLVERLPRPPLNS